MILAVNLDSNAVSIKSQQDTATDSREPGFASMLAGMVAGAHMPLMAAPTIAKTAEYVADKAPNEARVSEASPSRMDETKESRAQVSETEARPAPKKDLQSVDKPERSQSASTPESKQEDKGSIVRQATDADSQLKDAEARVQENASTTKGAEGKVENTDKQPVTQTTAPTVTTSKIPLTVQTTISAAVPTTISTTVQTAVPTTISAAVPTTIPTTVQTAIPTTIPTTVQTAIPTTIPVAAPTEIQTTVPIPVPTTDQTASQTIFQASMPKGVEAIAPESMIQAAAPIAAEAQTVQTQIQAQMVPTTSPGNLATPKPAIEMAAILQAVETKGTEANVPEAMIQTAVPMTTDAQIAQAQIKAQWVPGTTPGNLVAAKPALEMPVIPTIVGTKGTEANALESTIQAAAPMTTNAQIVQTQIKAQAVPGTNPVEVVPMTSSGDVATAKPALEMPVIPAVVGTKGTEAIAIEPMPHTAAPMTTDAQIAQAQIKAQAVPGTYPGDVAAAKPALEMVATPKAISTTDTGSNTASIAANDAKLPIVPVSASQAGSNAQQQATHMASTDPKTEAATPPMSAAFAAVLETTQKLTNTNTGQSRQPVQQETPIKPQAQLHSQTPVETLKTETPSSMVPKAEEGSGDPVTKLPEPSRAERTTQPPAASQSSTRITTEQVSVKELTSVPKALIQIPIPLLERSPLLMKNEGTKQESKVDVKPIETKTAEPPAASNASNAANAPKEAAATPQAANDVSTPKSEANPIAAPKFAAAPVSSATPTVRLDGLSMAQKPALDATGRVPTPMAQMEGTIKWMLKTSDQRVEMQFHPESLGKVMISLKVEGREVHAKVWASEPSTLPLLQEHKAFLEVSLREQGLSLGSFDLQQGQQGQGAKNPAQGAAWKLPDGGYRTVQEPRQEAPIAVAAISGDPHQLEMFA